MLSPYIYHSSVLISLYSSVNGLNNVKFDEAQILLAEFSLLLSFLPQPTHLFTAFRQSLLSPVTNNLDLFGTFHAEEKSGWSWMKLVIYLPLHNSLQILPLLSRLQKYRNTVAREATFSKVQAAKCYPQVYETSPVQLSPLIIWQCEAFYLRPRQPAISLRDFLLSYSTNGQGSSWDRESATPSVSGVWFLDGFGSFSSLLLMPRTPFIWKCLYCFQKAQITKGLQVGNPCSGSTTSSFSSRWCNLPVQESLI